MRERECPISYHWDDHVKECIWESKTCKVYEMTDVFVEDEKMHDSKWGKSEDVRQQNHMRQRAALYYYKSSKWNSMENAVDDETKGKKDEGEKLGGRKINKYDML